MNFLLLLFGFRYGVTLSYAACNPGWVMCQATGECLPKICLEKQQYPDDRCGDGQAYCEKMNSCVPYCHSKTLQTLARSARMATQCQGELKFCFSADKCLPQSSCSDEPGKIECPPGTSYCEQTNNCEKYKCTSLGQPSCPIGQVFCTESGLCSKACPDKIQKTDGLAPIKCPGSLMFCPATGRCTSETACNRRVKNASKAIKCPSNEEMCFEKGGCVPRGQCSNRDRAMQCSLNQIFCPQSGQCRSPGECGISKEENLQRFSCLHGEMFCPNLGRCAPADECRSRSAEVRSTTCHNPEEAFCFTTGQCQLRGSCGQRLQSTYSYMCPSNMIYCTETQECVDLKQGCCPGCSSRIKCREEGMAFCPELGHCNKTCNGESNKDKKPPRRTDPVSPTSICPAVANQWNYSTCLVNLHCPTSHSCCKDSETSHQQCVPWDKSQRGVTSPAVDACPTLENSNVDTNTGVECPENSPCPPGTICCSGNCRGRICPQKYLYCKYKRKCVKIGEEECGKTCPLGERHCIATDECTPINDCELDGAVAVSWMMPKQVMTTQKKENVIGESVKISDLYNDDVESLDPEELTVADIMSDDGIFEVQKGDTKEWIPVKKNDSIKTTYKLRFKTNPDTFRFSMAVLKTVHNATEGQHVIVQLIAPSFSQDSIIPKSDKFQTPEDFPMVIDLNEILLWSGGDNSRFWKEVKAGQELVKKLPELGDGFLDFSHSATKAWIELINSESPSEVKTSKNKLFDFIAKSKITIGFSGQQNGADTPPIADVYIFYITNESDLLPLASPFEPRPDSEIAFIKIDPIADASGKFQLSFNFTVPESALTTQDQKVKLNFEIVPINDPPELRKDRAIFGGLRLTSDNPYGTIKIEDLMRVLYTDVEDDYIGAVVIANRESTLLSYAFSTDDQATWTDMKAMNEDLLEEAEPSGDKMARLKSALGGTMSPRRLSRRGEGQNAAQSKDVTGLFLSPDVWLRFTYEEGDRRSISDYAKNAPLLLQAFDVSGEATVEKVFEKTISYPPKCSQCSNDDLTLSSEAVTIHPISIGCDGLFQISDTPKVFDRCGICGGNGSNCVDCLYEVKGSSILLCGACWNKNEMDCPDCDYSPDCQGNRCERTFANKVVDGIQICLPVNEPNMLFCDNSNSSGSYLNHCGICVEGNTNVAHADQVDKCGNCLDSGDSCIFNDDLLMDPCTRTYISSRDPDLKKCAIATPDPSYVDVALTNIAYEVRWEILDLDFKIYAVQDCMVTNIDSNEELEATEASIVEHSKSEASLLVMLEGLSVGEWEISCNLKPLEGITPVDPITSIKSNEKNNLWVVDSKRANPVALSQKEIFPREELQLKTEDKDVLAYGSCFIRYELSDGNFLVQELPTRHFQDNDDFKYLICSLSSPLEGPADIGISLSSDTTNSIKRGELDLDLAKINIKSYGGPILLSAELSRSEGTLTLYFTSTIEAQNCAQNFQPLGDLGKAPECTTDYSRLVVKLGDGHKIEEHSIINLSLDNGIKGKSEPSKSATGSANVELKQNELGRSFLLAGDTQACNASQVEFSVIVFPQKETKDYTVNLNVSYVKNDIKWDRVDVIEIWDTANIINSHINHENDSAAFSGEVLLSDVQYMIVAFVEWSDGTESEKQTLYLQKVKDDQEMLVKILGPSKLYASRSYTFEAEVIKCSKTAVIPKLQYLWEISGAVQMKEADLIGRTMTIPAGTLQSGSQYNLSVTVLSPSGSLSISSTKLLESYTISQFDARVSSDVMQVGYKSPIPMEVTITEHYSTRSQAIQSRYKCSKGDDVFCLTTRNERPALFENVLPKEELSKSKTQIPPHTLLPAQEWYTITFEVTNGIIEDTQKKNVSVKVLAKNLPVIKIVPQKSAFIISEPVVIEAIIGTQESAEVWWEFVPRNGSELMGIDKIASAGTQIQKIKASKAFRYHLVVPPADPSIGWSGFAPEKSYVFRICARTRKDAFSYSEVLVKMGPVPKGVTLKVTPSSGNALTTPFMINITIKDVDLWNLPYDVILKLDQSSGSGIISSTLPSANQDRSVDLLRMGTIKNVYRSFSVNKTLPSGKDMTLIAEVYNTMGSFITLTSQKINVDLPDEDQITEQIYREQIDELTELLLKDDLTKEFFTKVNEIFSTIIKTKDSETVKETSDSISDLLIQKAKQIIQGISSSNEFKDAAYDFLNGILSIPGIESSLKLMDVVDEMINILSPFNEIEDTPLTDSAGPTERRSNPARNKRSPTTGLTPASDSNKPYTKKQIETLLNSEEAIITSKDQGKAVRRLEKLISNLDSYIKSVCQHLAMATEDTLYSGLLTIRTIRSNLLGDFLKSPTVVKPKLDSTQYGVNVTWGEGLEQYKDWNCSKEGGKKVQCAGLCLSVVTFNDLFYAPVYTSLDSAIIRSSMSKTVLLNPTLNGTAKPSIANKHHVKISFEVPPIKNSTGEILVCRKWRKNRWSTKGCVKDVNPIRRRSQPLNTHVCLCESVGYTAIFRANGNRNNAGKPPLNSTSTLLTTRIINITVTIEGDFETSVKGRVKDFVDEMEEQFAQSIGVPKEDVTIIDVRPGSIVMDVEVKVTEGSRSSSSESVQTTSALQALVDNNFAFSGLDKESLKLLDIRINDGQTVQAIDESTLPLLIGGIVGGVLLLAVVLFILAIYLNKKKRLDKVTPLSNSGTMPTYMKMGRDDGLDGTVGSFSKIKSQASSGRSSYADQDGFSVHRKSGNPSRSDSGYGDYVPGPYPYRAPTDRQVRESGKIPDHIKTKLHKTIP